MVNLLSEQYDMPIYISIEEEVALNNRVIEGKIYVSTIHQFKGSKCDLVILFGLDSSFFEYVGRDLPDDSYPNEIFMALTRAAKQLVLVHFEEAKLMPFTSVTALYETADIINITRNRNRIEPPKAPGRPLERGLILPRSPLPKDKHIRLLDIVVSDRGKRFHEAVSDLNGLVVIAAFEYEIARTLDTLELN